MKARERFAGLRRESDHAKEQGHQGKEWRQSGHPGRHLRGPGSAGQAQGTEEERGIPFFKGNERAPTLA